jgi:NAD dependent epimerase/dehydratase family
VEALSRRSVPLCTLQDRGNRDGSPTSHPDDGNFVLVVQAACCWCAWRSSRQVWAEKASHGGYGGHGRFYSYFFVLWSISMKIFITGICGFVGSAVARRLREILPDSDLFGVDNLSRAGSEMNRRLAAYGIRCWHGDIRSASDLESLPPADWVIDAAALPSVLAGVDNRSSSRQLVEHNLFGTVNILEYCRRSGHCPNYHWRSMENDLCRDSQKLKSRESHLPV